MLVEPREEAVTARIVAAFAGAPWVGALAWCVPVSIWSPDTPGFEMAALLMFACAAAVAPGLPLLWCYRRFGVQRFSAYALGGLAIGLLLGLLSFTTPTFRVSAAFGGAAGASFFWALAVRSGTARGPSR